MKYYVYKRKAEWVEPPISTNSDMSDWLNWYRWKEWECLGYTEGAKELYLVLGKYIESVNSFLEQTTFKSLYTPSAQFLILDEKRRIRDYQELIRNIKTHRQYRKYCKSRWRWPENHSEQKRSITPEEVQEIRFKYNIDLKPIKNKRYKKYTRPRMVNTYGFNRSNLWIDIKSWLNPKSIGSILSNYYRINDELKKLVNLALLSILMFILSHISQIFIPLNRNVFSLTFVLRMAEYIYFISMLTYLLCDIVGLSFGTSLLKRVGLNAVAIILLDTAVHELIKFIHIKSIYTATWLPFNNWFTTDFILPITGTDYASAIYSVFITVIWVLLFNLLEKYKLKINI